MSSPGRPQPTVASRRSYFLEAPMEEYTPANSILDDRSSRDSVRGRGRSRGRGRGRGRGQGRVLFWTEGRGRLVLRVLNAVGHLGLSAVLLAIMGEFMARYGGHSRRPQAVALTVLVVADCCLDIYSAVRPRKKWHGWALMLRLLLSLGYIAQFFVYVGFREVFPRNYSYWGMSASYSEPVVYLLLWLLGLWDLLHTTIHRHTFGRDLRRYMNFFLNLRRRGTETSHGSAHDSWTMSRSQERQRRPATQALAEHDPESEVPIALAQVGSEDKEPDAAVMMTTRSGTSSTSDDSLSQARTLSRAESKTTEAGTSRRPSTAASEETLDADGKANGVARTKSKS